jgi:hypothetical protein
MSVSRSQSQDMFQNMPRSIFSMCATMCQTRQYKLPSSRLAIKTDRSRMIQVRVLMPCYCVLTHNWLGFSSSWISRCGTPRSASLVISRRHYGASKRLRQQGTREAHYPVQTTASRPEYIRLEPVHRASLAHRNRA